MPIVSTLTYLSTVPALCTVTIRKPTAEATVTPGGAKLVRRDLGWSHSEVFATPYGTLTNLDHPNVPDLTTVHTPDPSCIDRWVLRSSQTCGDDSSTGDVVWSVNPTRSIVSDPSYTTCQLYGKPTYSPGICPSGQSIAEVTAFESTVGNGTRTFWQASCCRSGMNFGSEYADLCLSYFSTPFRAYAVIMTAAAYDGEVVTLVYDYTSHYSPSGSTVISSIKTITTGLAVADPVIVAWQIDDVETFPSEYVKSLVARYTDVPAPASTSTPTVNALKPTTPPAAVSNGISTGTQIGIGVGVALAAALIGGLLIFWCLRRRKALATEEQDAVMPEMEDQDHTHSERKWYFGGRWRSEVDARATQNELDSKAVHVVPGPPAELEAHEPAVEETSITGHNNDRPLERV